MSRTALRSKLFEERDVPGGRQYAGEADARYLGFASPKPAAANAIGEDVVVRYDELWREALGLATAGVGRRPAHAVAKRA